MLWRIDDSLSSPAARCSSIHSMTSASVTSASRIFPNFGTTCRRPRLRSSFAFRFVRPSANCANSALNVGESSGSSMPDAPPRDPALDLGDPALRQRLGRLLRSSVHPAPVFAVADVPVRLVLRAAVEDGPHVVSASGLLHIYYSGPTAAHARREDSTRSNLSESYTCWRSGRDLNPRPPA